jgi:hypothetical protein
MLLRNTHTDIWTVYGCTLSYIQQAQQGIYLEMGDFAHTGFYKKEIHYLLSSNIVV